MSGGRTHVAGAGVSGPLLGMVLFVASEVMFFGGLFAAYFTLRGAAAEWPPAGTEPGLGLVAAISVLLFASSVTAHIAAGAARRNDRRRFKAAMTATIALGALFVAGQALEYSHLAFGMQDGTYGSVFFTITGAHGAHVIAGLAALGLALMNGLRDDGLVRRRGQVEGAVLLWHFVDAVWVLVLVTIYLA